MELFQQTGAYLKGHFRLTSGLHSGEYLQCAKVLAFPAYAQEFGQQLANQLRPLLPKAPSLVVSPAIGGIVIGHEVARALGTRAFFTERNSATNTMLLRRGFEVSPAEPVVVIEDVITTGGSTRDVIQALQTAGADVLAAASIIDRSGGQADVGLPRVALQTFHPITYDPADCPLCRAGTPIVKPGSRAV
jgi:orotate phosphoribosyltransferase